MNQAAAEDAAKLLVRARTTGERLHALPAHLKPQNFDDSLAVMAAVDRIVGDRIIGTKIAAKPGAEAVYTTLHAGRAFDSPARIPVALVPSKYMECEISFRLTRDLPLRAARRGIFASGSVRRARSLHRVRGGRLPLQGSRGDDGEIAV